MAEAMNIPFLVELPLDPKVRIGGDSGAPAALDPLGAGAAFHELATMVTDAMAGLSKKAGPKITLED
jgi:ATP-binding protein involved in chromosome partitioning